MSPLWNQPSILRIRVPAPGGEEPRSHPKQPHPPSVVAQVRHLVETTRLPYRVIATRARVNNGTVSRWAEKHGWRRPPGAWPANRRPERRCVPVVIGRGLATRLRMQAERLVAEIEQAERVDPARLAEALGLLAQAREEQRVRRGKRRMPPPPPPAEPREKPELDPATRARVTETRRLAGHKGWATRRARQGEPPAWMQAGARERALLARLRQERRAERAFEKTLPSPHLHPVPQPAYAPKRDRRAAAINGWKRRYARLREAAVKDKKDG